MAKQRLDKIISSQSGISRSSAREAIRKGKAAVNGAAVCDPSYRADPENDEITFDGQAVCYKKHIYIVMNKPAGVLSASTDKSKKTVIDLIPPEIYRRGLFPVGRLDKNTTGLLIITDDGDFAHRVLTPQKSIYKTYTAELDGPVTEETVKFFYDGVTLKDGTECRKAYLKPLAGNCAEIKICEGKFHQIKRMFGVVGLGVNALKRTAVGGYILPSSLEEGECKEVKFEQLNSIFKYKI